MVPTNTEAARFGGYENSAGDYGDWPSELVVHFFEMSRSPTEWDMSVLAWFRERFTYTSRVPIIVIASSRYYSCYSNPYRRYLCQLTSMSWWPIVCRPCCLFHVLLLFRIVAIYDPRIDKGLRAKLHHSSNLGNWTRTVAYSTRLSQDLRSQYSEVYPSPWKIRGVLRMGAQCILISEDVDFR